MYLHDPFWNVLNFSVFGHISCSKYDVPWYGIKKDDSIDVHEFTENGDLIVLINDGLGDTFYLNMLHMLDLAPHYFAF